MQTNEEIKKKELVKAFAKVLKKHRKNKRISITQISGEIGLSKSAWADAERAERDVKLSTFLQLSEALEIEPTEFLKEVLSKLPSGWSFLD